MLVLSLHLYQSKTNRITSENITKLIYPSHMTKDCHHLKSFHPESLQYDCIHNVPTV